jgi:ABC-type amino acid transport substrate-binding protein
MIDALSDHDVDMVFIDTPVAKYWDRKSSGDLKIYGQPSPYAYGLGIGINPKNAKLIKDIDKALNQYLNSQDFQSNYEIYFGN